MQTSDFDYPLPPERIAQTPIEPRHASRLLVLLRATGELEHRTFWEVGEYLRPGDVLVINRTRVIPARIFARKPTGGRIELLLLRRVDPLTWETLVGGKRVQPGMRLELEGGPQAEVIERLEGSRRLVRFSEAVEPYLEQAGQMPLPPYIHTPLLNPERYQTVYARQPGSAAAPTAGLHFTPELMQHLTATGIQFAEVTLHVGLDTFAPVNEDNPQEHKIHTEWCELTPAAAAQINAARRAGGRIIAVGTTSVRTLETAARAAAPGDATQKDNASQSVPAPQGDTPSQADIVAPFSGVTGLFILPGFKFKAVDGMITNFHLPRSTLLMLVSSFATREQILNAYTEAIRREYRFYSFGDAMLIL